MIIRLFTVAIVMILMVGLIPCNALATNKIDGTEIIWLEDGSYLEISIEKLPARGASTVSGSKKYTCYASDNSKLWEAKLTATFNYSGAWYTCSVANCNVTIYDNNWYVVSNNTIRSSNNAQTNLTMGRKVLGVTVEQRQYTIKLTCDNNGNLS